jgi:hypothetical protein|tara:strand:- start:19212 stop:20132 length:921 start_codon:yes stop_codon:yes gene_type:complete
MAVSGFNQLAGRIASGANNIAQVARVADRFTNSNTLRSIGRGAETVRNIGSAAQTFMDSGGNFGTATRMMGNAQQGVRFNAAPPSPGNPKQAIVSTSIDANYSNTDWRVSISVPSSIHEESEILEPLKLTEQGASKTAKMIFPFTPTILLGHSANYSQIAPTHTNYPYNAYENSQVDNMTITGEFYNENNQDAKYWVAVLHFLRSVTKMYYGESNPQGNPPPVCRLNGYGPHVLNNIPIVVQNFTTDLPADVDYIECIVDGHKNMVPVQCQFTVTVMPQYSRRSTAKFSLNTFAKGGFVKGIEGFV